MVGPPANRPTFGLVMIRVALGAILVRHGWAAMQGGLVTGADVRDGVRATLADVPGIVAWWGETVLLANPDGIAFLWRWAALLCGAGLLFGALTRPAGTVAALFAFQAFLFAEGETRLVLGLIAIACAACAVSRAGRRLGFDTMFDQHFSPWFTWTRRRGAAFP